MTKTIDDLIKNCRQLCPAGTRPSVDEALAMIAEIDRLNSELALWRGRWEAERRDHEATIKHCDEMLQER